MLSGPPSTMIFIRDFPSSYAVSTRSRPSSRGRPAHAAQHERAHAVGQRAVDVVDLDDARHLDRGPTPRRCHGPPGERLEGVGADPVLPADADGLEPAVAHVAPHRLHVEPEQGRHVFDGVQLRHFKFPLLEATREV